MSGHEAKPVTALCPWCEATIVAVGSCLVDGTALETCHAWRCEQCDTCLDCLGLPIQFDQIVFNLPGIENCRFASPRTQCIGQND